MTAITKIPFEHVTREGVEKIQSAVALGRQQALSFVESSIRRGTEEFIEFFAPSMSAFEIEFENRREQWSKFKSDLFEASVVLPVFATILLSLYIYFIYSLFGENADLNARGGLAFSVTVLGTVPFLASLVAFFTVRHYLAERKLGFISKFEEGCISLNSETGWGLSEKALYICAPRQGVKGVLEIKRIAFADVQAFTYSEVDGHEYANVVTQAGETFRLAMPEGRKISGARNVVNHLNKAAMGNIAV